MTARFNFECGDKYQEMFIWMIWFKYIFSRLTNCNNSGSGIDDPGIEAASRKNPSSHYAAVNGTRNSRDSSGDFFLANKQQNIDIIDIFIYIILSLIKKN